MINVLIEYVGLVVSVFLLVDGVTEYRRGGSVWWPLLGVALVLTAVYSIYRETRTRRRNRRRQD